MCDTNVGHECRTYIVTDGLRFTRTTSTGGEAFPLSLTVGDIEVVGLGGG
jgi:hypothetical protein